MKSLKGLKGLNFLLSIARLKALLLEGLGLKWSGSVFHQFLINLILSFLATNKTIEQSTPRESPQPRNTKVPPILLNVSIDVGILTLKKKS